MPNRFFFNHDTDLGFAGHEQVGRRLIEQRVDCMLTSGDFLARSSKVQAERITDGRQAQAAAKAAVIVKQEIITNVAELRPNQPTSPFYPPQANSAPVASLETSELDPVEQNQQVMAAEARRQAEDSYKEAA